MGVYIKGVTKEGLIEILRYENIFDAMNIKTDFIEVPEPHGRLIDADAYYANKCENQYYFLKDAPTVIEAEGE